jgi:hypothetical protein
VTYLEGKEPSQFNSIRASLGSAIWEGGHGEGKEDYIWG